MYQMHSENKQMHNEIYGKLQNGTSFGKSKQKSFIYR